MIRIGISCCRYEPWRGVFYREGLAQRRELEYAARHFPIVEINGSFYSLQRPAYYEEWYRAAPRGKTGTLSVCFPISPISALGREATNG